MSPTVFYFSIILTLFAPVSTICTLAFGSTLPGRCSQDKASALAPLSLNSKERVDSLYISFFEECHGMKCKVKAVVLPKHEEIALFELNDHHFWTCSGSQDEADEQPRPGCPSAYHVADRIIRIDNPSDQIKYSVLHFQVVTSLDPAQGKLCYDHGYFDGPTTVQFTARYSEADVLLYVYEVDDYKSQNSALSAQPMLLKQPVAKDGSTR